MSFGQQNQTGIRELKVFYENKVGPRCYTFNTKVLESNHYSENKSNAAFGSLIKDIPRILLPKPSVIGFDF